MSRIESLVDGSQKLMALFGTWPSFHDAEVIDLHFWRGHVRPGDRDDANVFPILTIKIRILEATQPGANHAGNDSIVTLRFHDVSDFKMDGFNHCNQIVGLSIETQARGKFLDGTDLPPYLVVRFEPGFGVGASFHCFRAEIVGVERCAEDEEL